MTNRIQPQRPALLTPAVQPKVSKRQGPPPTPATAPAPANTTRLAELQTSGALRKGQLLAVAATTSPTRIFPTGPLTGAPRNPAAPPPVSPLASDSRLNGAAFRMTAPGVNPNAGPPVIVVNGIATPFSGAAGLAQEMSRMTGRPVEMVYNNSDPVVAAGMSLTHHARQARARAEADYDKLPLPLRFTMNIVSPASREAFILGRTTRYLAEATVNPATADWVKRNALQNPPAAQTQANMILSQLASYPNDPVHIIGYSQGAAISAEALRMVERELVRQHGVATANQMLSRVQVLTLGGAANANDFPAAVNVTSIAHQSDIVGQYFGANRQAFGRGNRGDFVNFVRDGFGVPQHLNYFGANGNPEVARRMQDWMRNPASVDRNVILPDYRG
ncbi:MAG: lipase family protein [Acidobacteriota bacterium]